MGVSQSALSDSDVVFLQRRNSLSAETILKMHEVFSLMACSGCTMGEISLEKMIQGCVKAGMSDDQMDSLRVLFPVLDRNKNGMVDFQEYVLAIAVMTDKAHLEQKLDLAFSLFDKDGDRRITKEEMSGVLKRLNRIIEITEFYSTSDHNDETQGIVVISGADFVLMTGGDFDDQIDSWVSQLYTEFDLDNSHFLDLEAFERVVRRHPFLVELHSRLVTEGPAEFLTGSSSSEDYPSYDEPVSQ
eukprot:RCo046262